MSLFFQQKPAMADTDDALLVDRVRAGEEAAFVALVERHHAGLVRVARNFVRDQASAEDVAQDTWVAVLRGLAAFEGRSRFKTWLYHILANRARTRAVRDQRLVPIDMTADEGTAAVDRSRFNTRGMWSEPPVAWRDAELALGNQQLVAFLEQAMQTLPANQRLVVTMRDVEGLDSDEVCNVLGIAETNQRVLLHRARARLRAMLEAHLGKTP